MKTGYHEINQISVLRCSDEKQLCLKIAVNFPSRANPVSLEIQGITLADLREGLDKKDALTQIHNFIEEDGSSQRHRCIIAHNASFDRRFCHMEWDAVDLAFPADLWLCTQKFGKKYVKSKNLEARVASAQHEKKPKFGLNPLLVGLGLNVVEGAHDAGVDVTNTNTLFKFFMESGVEHVSSMERKPHKEIVKKADDYDISDF